MGKLHTLRRAIERDPERWIMEGFFISDGIFACSAYRYPNGEWRPIRHQWSPGPYRNFVKKVLRELDYNVK